MQKFPHNVTNYDGSTSNQVIYSRGVYSSVDIEEGTAIAFVPARHILHGAEFNRSTIWRSIAALNLAATNHSRTEQLALGELMLHLGVIIVRDLPTDYIYSCWNISAASQLMLPLQLSLMSSATRARFGCHICMPRTPFLSSLFPSAFPFLGLYPITSHSVTRVDSCNLPSTYDGSALTWTKQKMKARLVKTVFWFRT